MVNPAGAALRKSLEKSFGAKLRRIDTPVVYDPIPSGILSLDYATSLGGYPRRRLTELWGPPGSCKTTAALLAEASAQRKYPKEAILHIDMERSFSDVWAESHGVKVYDNDLFLKFDPWHSEDIANFLSKALPQGGISLVVVDSIGAMESAAAFEKEAEKSAMGKNSQVITRMLKEAAVLADEYNAALLLINQVRANVGGTGPGAGYDVGAGPRILGHMTTLKIKFSRTGRKKEATVGGQLIPVAKEFRARVERNRLAPEGRVAEFWLNTVKTKTNGGVGIDPVPEAVKMGKLTGVIPMKGSYFVFPSGTQTLGEDKAVAYLAKNPKELAEVQRLVIQSRAHEVREEVEVTYEPEEGEG